MTRISVNKSSTINYDRVGTGSGWIAAISRGRQGSQERISELTFVNRVQYGWIISGLTLGSKTDVVKRIDVIVAYIESGVLIEIWRGNLHARVIYSGYQLCQV